MNVRALRLVAAVVLPALTASCSSWILGVVQSFGAPSDAKISTVVGSGTRGYAGDGGPATSAELNQPYAVAVDSSDNIYVADTDNSLIRKVDSSGNITTVAGNHNSGAGFSGDPGSATDATLNQPCGLAIDASGNIYIADTVNYVIRKVDLSGNISTVAGTHRVSGFTGDGGPATSAVLGLFYGIAIGSAGDLFIADQGNNVVWMVDHSTGNISTVAGNHTKGAGYSGDGNQATQAELNTPFAVAVDVSGDIYIADTYNNVIRRVDLSGVIATVAGNTIRGYSGDGGPATEAELDRPTGVTVDAAGNVYVSDAGTLVRKIDTSGNITTVAGNYHLGAGYAGDGNVATAAKLDGPMGLATDSLGNLLIADEGSSRIRKVGVAK
jgi:sugar lactone lactonase YvrE